MRAPVAGTMQSVRLVLPLADYQVAIDAHDSRQNLACVGVARKQGGLLLIESPSEVRVVDS